MSCNLHNRSTYHWLAFPFARRLKAIKGLDKTSRDDFCLDWINEKCFDLQCKKPIHPETRSDSEINEDVFITFSASRKLDEALLAWIWWPRKAREDKERITTSSLESQNSIFEKYDFPWCGQHDSVLSKQSLTHFCRFFKKSIDPSLSD